MKRPVEKIEWVDSSGRSGWDSNKTYLEYAETKDLTAVSIGFVIFESKDRIAIAQNLTESEMDFVMVIPTCAILRRIVMDEA
jgi:hypothetical protein